MPECVPVCCPVCRREHVYTALPYPCACGAPAAPRLDPAAGPVVARHRAWDEEWVSVRCAACGRTNQWPNPELGCACGTVLRLAVCPVSPSMNGGATPAPAPAPVPAPGADAHIRRSAFQPHVIRTARDAVTVAALYLRWLGYRGIRRADQRPVNGVGLAAHGVIAQVDPSVRPASVRDVECLWLTAMTDSARCVYFSLAGYAVDARARAAALGVPLFVLDLTGTPQPVNDPADELNAMGA